MTTKQQPLKKLAKHVSLTKDEIRNNRKIIRDMWEKIPDSWIDLDVVIEVPKELETRLLDKGKDPELEALKLCKGPKNECKAVGCFLGWNYMCPTYQAWCKRNKLVVTSEANVLAFLGLSRTESDLFDIRRKPSISQKEEVNLRIKNMMRAAIRWDYSDPTVDFDELLILTSSI